MAKGQASVSTIGKMADILKEAYQTFPDATNDSQAYTRALFHWYHNREDNSKSGALKRIEAMLRRLLDTLEPGK